MTTCQYCIASLTVIHLNQAELDLASLSFYACLSIWILTTDLHMTGELVYCIYLTDRFSFLESVIAAICMGEHEEYTGLRNVR